MTDDERRAKEAWDKDRVEMAKVNWPMPAWSRAPAWRRRPYLIIAQAEEIVGHSLQENAAP